MVTIGAVPSKNYNRMSAGFDAIFTATQCAPERVSGIAVVIKHEVGMAVAFEPTGNLCILISNGGPDGGLCARTVVPCGSGRNVAFAVEALAQLSVGASDVFAERVSARRFVLGKIVARIGEGFG